MKFLIRSFTKLVCCTRFFPSGIGQRFGPKQIARLKGSICVSSLISKDQIRSLLIANFTSPVLWQILKESKEVPGNSHMRFRPLLYDCLSFHYKLKSFSIIWSSLRNDLFHLRAKKSHFLNSSLSQKGNEEVDNFLLETKQHYQN